MSYFANVKHAVNFHTFISVLTSFRNTRAVCSYICQSCSPYLVLIRSARLALFRHFSLFLIRSLGFISSVTVHLTFQISSVNVVEEISF